MPNRSLSCVAFDSTGTLVYPDPPAAVVYHRVGIDLGSAKSEQAVRNDLSSAMRRRFLGEVAMRETSPEYERARWRMIVADALDDLPAEDADLAFDRLWHHFADPNHWSVYDDVADTLQRLSERGIRTAVASNFDDRLLPVLEGNGLGARFDEVFVSSRLGYSKPNPAFFETIAKRLEVHDPSKLLMIGDTVGNDVDAAITAGWKAELVHRDSGRGLLQILDDWFP